MRFRGGVLCSISGDFSSPRKADRFVIAGDRGVICSERLDGHAFTLDSGGATEEFKFGRDSAPHLGLVRHIERVIDGREANASSGMDGMLTDRILDEGMRWQRV